MASRTDLEKILYLQQQLSSQDRLEALLAARTQCVIRPGDLPSPRRHQRTSQGQALLWRALPWSAPPLLAPPLAGTSRPGTSPPGTSVARPRPAHPQPAHPQLAHPQPAHPQLAHPPAGTSAAGASSAGGSTSGARPVSALVGATPSSGPSRPRPRRRSWSARLQRPHQPLPLRPRPLHPRPGQSHSAPPAPPLRLMYF